MLAKLLNDDWDAAEKNIAFARVQGKSNIQNYRTFFSSFEIPVSVICDLDVITDGFERIVSGDTFKVTRDALLKALDELESADKELTSSQVRDFERNGDTRSHLREAREAHELGQTADAINSLERIFAYVRRSDRLANLVNPDDDGEVARLKSALLQELALEDCHVLSRGAVEEYYASTNKKRDKVQQAVEFRADRPDLAKYRQSLGDRADAVIAELSGIFSKIFA